MGTGPVVFAHACAPVPTELLAIMTAFSSPPCWLHRGCRIQLIDEQIQLLRQRLAASS
jgi:hypothetical protein